ncbi:hypothetical protein EM858_04395 [Agrobacterium sp. CNPSo 2736]|uniref:hypothetical protein n=1 Tax=Agrobacterium sp. CNPSo 2736 TaxID=2499627 RepID=UPI000FDC255F|nr:hypothetical protein [Agrobacterium sp. CNPSo 2736]RVT80240.1 hypothetical protein EM858_04395 [Agrobacterium sp. CNPSo 2736]
MRIKKIALLVPVLMLSGCVSETEYNRLQEVMNGSSAARQYAINECYAKTIKAPAHETANVRIIMNLSPKANVQKTFCTRAVNGVASKRITYRDYVNKTPNFIRVIQGR